MRKLQFQHMVMGVTYSFEVFRRDAEGTVLNYLEVAENVLPICEVVYAL